MIKFIKKYWYVIIVVLFFLVLVLTTNKKEEVVENVSDIEISTFEKIEETSTLFVDIKGEVNTPGVYELENNKRIIDAINIAGGLTEKADTSLINLSKKLTDEMNIIIYSKEEVESVKNALTPTIVEVIKEINTCQCPNDDECDNNNDALIDTLININTASKEELLTIPKIGESKADAIISYRKENKFITIEDIKNVSGIGDSLFESIKSYITV